MSDSSIYVYLFQTHSELTLPFLHDLANACELSFVHPLNESFITWSATESALVRPISALHDAIVLGGPIGFDMWWPDLSNLLWFYNPTGELTYINMALRGVSQSRQGQLVASLRGLMLSTTYNTLISALIVDSYGYSEDVDWTDRILHGLRREDPFPELVLFSTALPAYITLDRDAFTSELLSSSVASIAPLITQT